jgi:hypothetical protein
MTNLSELLLLLQITGQNLALFSSGLFSGAAIYVSLTECPPRTALNRADLLALAHSVAGRTNTLLMSLAAVTTLMATLAAIAGGGRFWLIGGVIHALLLGYLLTDVRRAAIELETLDPHAGSDAEGDRLLQRRALQFGVLGLGGLVAQYLFIVAR